MTTTPSLLKALSALHSLRLKGNFPSPSTSTTYSWYSGSSKSVDLHV